MLDFQHYNPTRIVFGKTSIAELRELVPAHCPVLVTYGGGSIMRNGVYEQIEAALDEHNVTAFGGIEPNPTYETCMRAVEQCRSEEIGFIVAAGGGSVIDATKFIAAAVPFAGEPWDILSARAPIESALPFGTVLTLPATGSEMNPHSVISRKEPLEKLGFSNEKVYPRFSVLDPETTYSLPERQTVNGLVDCFVHVAEQYFTYPVDAPLQDRMAEGVWLTLIAEGPRVLADPRNYDARATIMWNCTVALNGWLACGVPQDWATHAIGHELTALYGIDHARTLAIVLPGLLRHQRHRKEAKLRQYARRVWGIDAPHANAAIEAAIARTEEFFQSLGVGTRLHDYDVDADAAAKVGARVAERHSGLGEHGDIGPDDVEAILRARA
jgi:NADP-dependent alcohol dehydrogenase